MAGDIQRGLLLGAVCHAANVSELLHQLVVDTSPNHLGWVRSEKADPFG